MREACREMAKVPAFLLILACVVVAMYTIVLVLLTTQFSHTRPSIVESDVHVQPARRAQLAFPAAESTNLFVNVDTAARMLEEACPETDLANLVRGVSVADFDAQVALLVRIANDCPQSELPFAARELWHHHVDAAIRTEKGPDHDAAILDLCTERRDLTRACIVMLFTPIIMRNALAMRAYLDANPHESIVAISACNCDNCLPFHTYHPDNVTGLDSEKENTTQGFRELLEHPRLLAWFAENPCFLHPKIIPIPIGPKFKWLHTDLHPKREPYIPIKRRLARTLEMALWKDRSARDRTMLIAVSISSTDHSKHGSFTGVRRQAVDHMLQLADHGFPAFNFSSSMKSYSRALVEHRFVWAPPGAGTDSHRMWEALLAGAIPIVIRSPLSPMYRELQLIEVDVYSKLDRTMMDHVWGTVSHKAEDWLSPKLFAFYWMDLFERAARGEPVL